MSHENYDGAGSIPQKRKYRDTDVTSLITAARTYARTNPAFRSKPMGAPGSDARLRQQDQIAAEDALWEAIRKVEAGGSL